MQSWDLLLSLLNRSVSTTWVVHSCLLCCSHTAREQLNSKYGSDICLFETTSLYGSTKSSSQYDGLKPYMRYRGLTDMRFYTALTRRYIQRPEQMVHTKQRQTPGKGGRIESQTQDSTKDDINHQEELTFSKGCGVHNCDCKCKKSD